MLESLAEWMGYPLYYAFDGAPPPPRSGAAHATIAPYGPYATADGTVMLGVQNEREWQAFCTGVLGQPALAADPRFDSGAQRNIHRAELQAVIEAVLTTLASAQVLARLDAAQIANASVNDMAGLWAHPQLAARDRWRQVATPGGTIPALLPPGANSSFETRMDAIPAVGQHTEAILRELGRSDADIAALRTSAAI
jgi:itaconate CoA-transferase